MNVTRVPISVTLHAPTGDPFPLELEHVIGLEDGEEAEGAEGYAFVQGLLALEEAGGARIAPQVAYIKKQVGREHPLRSYMNTPTTIHLFTLKKNMKGVGKKGHAYLLIDHDVLPFGFASKAVIDALNNHRTVPGNGIIESLDMVTNRLEALRDTDNLIRARDLTTPYLIPGYGILLTNWNAHSRKKKRLLGQAILGGQTGYFKHAPKILPTETVTFNISEQIYTKIPEGKAGVWLTNMFGRNFSFGFPDYLLHPPHTSFLVDRA